MANTIFDRPDLTAFTGLDGLGLEVTGQHIEADHAVLACRVTGEDRWCRRCGCQGICRDTVVRRPAHVPCGGRPTILRVSVRRSRCPECAHVWRHTPYGDRYVTVILDLTPVRDRRGPCRLLDMVPGRSKRVFTTWLSSQPDTWRENIEIVAMDGFTGFKSAAAEELPDARAVMDPFHVVHLAGDALDECRRRIGQELHHRRGRATDPLYKARRMLHTRSCLLTPRQQHQLLNLFSGEEHVALEVTWSAYQNIIDAYRAPDTDVGKALMQAEINTLTCTCVPRGLRELITLGRTLKRRAGDILAYFDHPHTSNGPTEAINGRLEHLRGSALGFRNLTNYITRALLETGGFRPQLHPQL